MSSRISCPACGTALDDRRELGAYRGGEGATLEHVRYECGGCRAVVGRDFRLPPGGAGIGRDPAGPPEVVITGARASRALAPLETRARDGDRAGVLDALRSLQSDDEHAFLGVTDAAQRAARGIAVRLARHAAVPVLFRPSAGLGGPTLRMLFPSNRLPVVPVRVLEDLRLDGDRLEEGGVILPPPGAIEAPGAPEALLLLGGTRLVAEGTALGVLRLRPPDPRPTLEGWGPVQELHAGLNLVAAD